MGKQILIIANTYYQLICAIQMRLSIFKKDDVCLLVSDHSVNADKICKKIDRKKIFFQIRYINTKGLINSRNNKQKIADFFDIVFKSENRYSFYLKGIANIAFDELICYNYGIDIIGLYSILYEKNKEVKVSLYEEGILSYGVYFEGNIRRDAINIFRKILRKKDISEAFNRFYCFYPQLYKGILPTTAVPLIYSGSECADILRDIFDINKTKLEYPQRYIYFSNVYDFEGGAPIGEYELIKKISALVGKENLMIKTHPRDTRKVFKNNGFIVDQNSNIPWEIVQLSGDFSDKVFMTATSGSVLAGSFMSEKPVKTFYMYKMCDISGNRTAQETARDIEALIQDRSIKEILRKVKVIESLDEIVNEKMEE